MACRVWDVIVRYAVARIRAISVCATKDADGSTYFTFEYELNKEMARSEVDLKKLEIEAIRAIGVAFGENQKAKTYNDHWIVR